jgi:hypothetical protein
MTHDKTIVYVNGDSFTEGSDMADHMYPFFKGYYSLKDITSQNIDVRLAEQTAAIDSKFNFHVERGSSDPLVQQINQFEYDNRWSNKLSEVINRPVYNLSSQGGSSMYAIAYRTMSDIYLLLQQGYTITDVIIQVTSAHRYSFFKNTEDHHEPQRKHNSRYYHILSGNTLHSPGLNKDLLKMIITEEPADMAEYRWLHDVYMLKNAIAQLTGARVIFVDSVFYVRTISDVNSFDFKYSPWLNKNPTDYLLDFKKTLDNEIKLSMLDCIDNDEPDTITNGMHFTAKVHERFAKLIARTYFND